MQPLRDGRALQPVEPFVEDAEQAGPVLDAVIDADTKLVVAATRPVPDNTAGAKA
ncbi:hypothetical protein [Streptomyces sp. NPDC056169]|uniref:hypothetical protein n=1 Tax=Streptomyces sp. NPDC056169 TaxID=3345734 RepID=UPI0035DAB8E0